MLTKRETYGFKLQNYISLNCRDLDDNVDAAKKGSGNLKKARSATIHVPDIV